MKKNGTGFYTAVLFAASVVLLNMSGCPVSPSLYVQDSSLPDSRPWLRSLPEGRRTFFVSPAGTGDGLVPEHPVNLNDALLQAEPGDRYMLLSGEYRGSFRLRVSGTPDEPIVYRAAERAHVRIKGGLSVSGDYNWIWGLDISDPDNIHDCDSISSTGKGTVLVNNVLHDEGFDTSLSSWNKPEQIVYGNIIYHGHHNIYTQNSRDNGLRYFVHNISMDAKKDENGGNGPFEFHAYAEGGDVSSFYLHGNIFANKTAGGGRVLLGGRNSTANDNFIVDGNYFYNARLQLGYRRPVQAVVCRNYLVNSLLSYEWFCGCGESRFPDMPAVVVKENRMYSDAENPRLTSVRTSAYLESGRNEGGPAFRRIDNWDWNYYSPGFSGTVHAAGSSERITGLDAWRGATGRRGKRFDAFSREVPYPDESFVVLLPNDYEEGRANLAVYNFGGDNSVEVDLSGVIQKRRPYFVYNAQDLFGNPVAEGVYYGRDVSIPVDSEFVVYIITSTASAP